MRALLPLVFFISIFLSFSLGLGDFYAAPMLSIFVLTALFSFLLFQRHGFANNLHAFCRASGDENIILMVLIFIMAGAFSSLSEEFGAVNAVVNCCLTHVPRDLLAAGIFAVCCFISVAMGSSMGVVLAVSPIVVGLAREAAVSQELLLGAMLGGAMFGDNLSTISDTTIAAVRTQACDQSEKFKENFRMVLPAALCTIVYYVFFAAGSSAATAMPLLVQDYELWRALPYFVIIGGALLKWNALLLLCVGCVVAAVLGLISGDFTLVRMMQSMQRGIVSMQELSMLSLVAAGTSGLIKENGGMRYLLDKINLLVRSSRGGELGISALVACFNLFTANNTIAIVMAGPIAQEIAEQYHIRRERSASLLDVFASAVQGLIPWGAQILTAVSFAGLSPFALLSANVYSLLTILAGLGAIFQLPQQFALYVRGMLPVSR